ncbi:tyrosine--tRNA ligase [Candidatus Falkowbacteria bacterium]|nr:tyrosine--tRNA ligase [Candidatus Falkowbacteria bacterium]
MIKISKDKDLINKFLTRGVEAIYPSKKELEKKLLSGERLRIYQGFDPTGKYLHVGHAMGIRALSILQQLGHEVIFLVGDYTAKVGDPDKDTGREMLSDKQIAENLKGWKEQAAQLIDFEGENPVRFERNYQWLSKLKPNDLIELMSKMTVQQMLERDMFDRRIKEGDPVGLHEFIYPLMQGYDGVAMEVDMEIGGADQTFNMLKGRDLVKSYLNKEKFVRANKMMDAPDGRTMSKTKGNGINLGDSSEDMYGKAMSYPDNLITMGLELLTEVPMNAIKEIDKNIKKGENPMQYKKMMAFEIVKTIRGEEEAIKAQRYFEDTVQKKAIPDEIEVKKMKAGAYSLIDIMVETGLAASKGEARRLITQGGVKVDGKKVNDIEAYVEVSDSETLIQKGKRGFMKIKS